jgi:hypothetical protein
MDLKGENKALHPVGSIQELNSFEMKYGSLIYGPVASVCMISGRKISSSSSLPTCIISYLNTSQGNYSYFFNLLRFGE